jgi:hypothetical protein
VQNEIFCQSLGQHAVQASRLEIEIHCHAQLMKGKGPRHRKGYMEENSTATMVNDSNASPAGVAPPMEGPFAPTASPEWAPANAMTPPTANAGLASSVPPADPSNVPASDGLGANIAASAAAQPVAKSVRRLEGVDELGRDSSSEVSYWKPKVEVEEGYESSLEKIIQRAEWVSRPSCGTPLPNGWEVSYGTTEQFYRRIQETFAEQALVSMQASSILAFFSLSTWFTDALPIAPCLAISGSAEEGDRVLQILRPFCHNPRMMIGLNIANLKTIYWIAPPTLLFYEPNLTKPMATFLGCSTRRGYVLGGWNDSKDFYCSKAIYLGENVPVDRKLQWSLQVNATSSTATTARLTPPLTDSGVQKLQNQLLGYRLKNLIKVENSTFDAPGLPADIRPVANALGACVVGSPKLQSELISLLAPQVEQRLADRSSSLEGMTIEAILSLSHQGKSRLLAGEIATEVNTISKTRGERLEFKAENVGHALKKVGLSTQRLGKAGKGLAVDQATLVRVHELGAKYGGVGLDGGGDNLHCALCEANKRAMQEV